MKIYTKILQFNTQASCELINLNEKVREVIKESGVLTGSVLVYTRHTTSAVVVNEYEEGLKVDVPEVLNELVQRKRGYKHDDFEIRCPPSNERRNGWAHLQSLLLGASQNIPLLDGKLMLGRWQAIMFVELDGPRPNREVIVQVSGEER